MCVEEAAGGGWRWCRRLHAPFCLPFYIPPPPRFSSCSLVERQHVHRSFHVTAAPLNCCLVYLSNHVICDKVNFLDFVVNLRFWTFLNSKQSPPPPPPLVPSPCRSSLRWIRRGVWLTSVMRWSPDRSWPSAAPPALSSTPNWNATRTRRPGVFWDSGQPVWGQWFLFLTLLRINLQLEHPNKCLIYSLRYISTWKLLF